MSKFVIVFMALVALASCLMKTGDRTKLEIQAKKSVDTSTWVADARVDGVVDGLDRMAVRPYVSFAKWRQDVDVTPVVEDAVKAEVESEAAVPAKAEDSAAPVKSGGSNGSYSQAAPVKSGGSNGSYAQATSQFSYSYSAPVYTEVRYRVPVRSGGSNGGYAQAAPVRQQPYRTVNAVVKSGGCTGSYQTAQVSVPVRGPIRKMFANAAARRDDRIVSPVSVQAPSYSMVPMQVADCPPDCDCYQDVSDGGNVSPYSAQQYNYATPMQIAPLATMTAPVRGFIDNLTPQRSTSRTICTPEGCVTIE